MYSQYQQPTWKDGNGNVKPTSVVQSLFMLQVNGGTNKRYYELEPIMLQQLQKARSQNSTVNRSECTKFMKFNKSDFPGTTKTSRKSRAAHFSLASNGISGPLLAILDEKIIYRLDKTSREVKFTEIDLNPRKLLNIKYFIRTETPGKFGNDRDIFHAPVNAGILRDCHPYLLLIPNDGRSVKSYHADTGRFIDSIEFEGDFECNKINCLDNGNIIVECKLQRTRIITGDAGILMEFLVLQHLPLRFESRVQILRTISNNCPKAPKRFEIVDDYLFGFYGTTNINLYDFQATLQKNKVPPDPNSSRHHRVTHQVRELPAPLMSVRCCDAFLTFTALQLPAYYIIRSQNIGYQVLEATRTAQIILKNYDELNFDDDPKVQFLCIAPPRVVVTGKNRLKIFLICQNATEDCEKTDEAHQPYLKLILDLNFSHQPEPSPFSIINGRSSRGIPRKRYDDLDHSTIVYDENDFLQQIAIVRFESKKISCYVYDSTNLNLQYELSEKRFLPAISEVYDNITLQFTNRYIAVIRKGTQDTTLYVFDLLKVIERKDL